MGTKKKSIMYIDKLYINYFKFSLTRFFKVKYFIHVNYKSVIIFIRRLKTDLSTVFQPIN